MTTIGYSLSSEKHALRERYARAAETAGFAFAVVDDHVHRSIDHQGQSPFVWSGVLAVSAAHLAS